MAISGFLTQAIAEVRTWLDEPSTNAKYTNAQIIRALEKAWVIVHGEYSRNCRSPILIRHDISVVGGTSTYVLPPSVGQIQRLAKVNASTDMAEYEYIPRHRLNPAGPNFVIEHNVIRFIPAAQSAETLRLEFVPKATARLHDGTAAAATSTTITLDATPDNGTLDERENAYAGSVVRILNGTTGTGQERIISAYNYLTRVATVSPAWGVTPSGTITYEIAPLIWEPYDAAITLYAARILCTPETDVKKITVITNAYRDFMREIRLQAIDVEERVGPHFAADVLDNDVFGLGSR